MLLQNLPANVEIEPRSFREATQRITAPTVLKMEQLAHKGYRFIVGNNPHAARPYGFSDAVKVSQVNSRYHGNSIRTIWAVRGAPR